MSKQNRSYKTRLDKFLQRLNVYIETYFDFLCIYKYMKNKDQFLFINTYKIKINFYI